MFHEPLRLSRLNHLLVHVSSFRYGALPFIPWPRDKKDSLPLFSPLGPSRELPLLHRMSASLSELTAVLRSSMPPQVGLRNLGFTFKLTRRATSRKMTKIRSQPLSEVVLPHYISNRETRGMSIHTNSFVHQKRLPLFKHTTSRLTRGE